jgi:hypothetical protein
MSARPAHRLIGLCLLTAAFALTEPIAIPAASAGQGKKLDPPTLLWKSYPLERPPSTTEPARAQIHQRPARRQTSAHQNDFLTPLLAGAFILLLASTATVLLRRRMQLRVGKARQTSDRAPIPGSAQPASVNEKHWRPQRQQQLWDVIPKRVREPQVPAPHCPAPQSDANVLEALQPNLPSLPAPEPTPEVAVAGLAEARVGRTPERVQQRQATQPKLHETGNRLVEKSEAGPSGESRLGLELLTRIVDVQLVPVPPPSGRLGKPEDA